MGICFVGEVPMKEFLQERIKPQPGKIVTSAGAIIGEHQGLPFYTIGQRHLNVKFQIPNSKFQINSKNKNPNTQPIYVVAKNFDTNELIVGYQDDPLLYKREIAISVPHWISGQPPAFPLQCQVRFRHRQPLQRCVIRNQESRIRIECELPQRAVTPGQFAVFYMDNECLGGGVIQ